MRGAKRAEKPDTQAKRAPLVNTLTHRLPGMLLGANTELKAKRQISHHPPACRLPDFRQAMIFLSLGFLLCIEGW